MLRGRRGALGAIPPIELHDQQTRAGRYRPVTDRTHPLDDVVEAIRYVEAQQKIGNVVMTVNAR